MERIVSCPVKKRRGMKIGDCVVDKETGTNENQASESLQIARLWKRR